MCHQTTLKTRQPLVFWAKNLVCRYRSMSVVGVIIEVSKEMENKMDNDLRVCVYDGTETYAYICPICREYDGLMKIEEAIKEYDFIAEMYADELAFMPS
jgi:hypothetical protein